MITAIVQYSLPPDIGPAACAAHFRKIAPDFRTVPGLIRKQFIYAEDGWAGGIYLWETRAAAEAFYAGPCLRGIRERYGMDPQIKFFATACVTDNAIDATALCEPFDQTPTLWWPTTHRWCVASEIDFHSTYVGGPRRLVDRLLGDDRIEALEVAIGAYVTD